MVHRMSRAAMRKKSTPKTTVLPLDLLYEVAHFADARSVVAMCLTSHTLYRTLFNSRAVWSSVLEHTPSRFHLAPNSLDPPTVNDSVQDIRDRATRPYRLEHALCKESSEDLGQGWFGCTEKERDEIDAKKPILHARVPEFRIPIEHRRELRWFRMLPGGRWLLALVCSWQDPTVISPANPAVPPTMVKLCCMDLRSITQDREGDRILAMTEDDDTDALVLYTFPSMRGYTREPCVQYDEKNEKVICVLAGLCWENRRTIEVIELSWDKQGIPAFSKRASYDDLPQSRTRRTSRFYMHLSGDYLTVYDFATIELWNWRENRRGEVVKGRKKEIQYAVFRAPFMCYAVAPPADGEDASEAPPLDPPVVRQLTDLANLPLSENGVMPAAPSRIAKVPLKTVEDGSEVDLPADAWTPESARRDESKMFESICVPVGNPDEHRREATGVLFGVSMADETDVQPSGPTRGSNSSRVQTSSSKQTATRPKARKRDVGPTAHLRFLPPEEFALPTSWYQLPNFGIVTKDGWEGTSLRWRMSSSNGTLRPHRKGHNQLTGSLVGPPFSEEAPRFHMLESEQLIMDVKGMCAVSGAWLTINPESRPDVRPYLILLYYL